MLHQLTQDAGGAGFVGALGCAFHGQVVGQFDHEVALRLVGVVVGHVQAEMGHDLVTVHVLHQLHHGVEHGAEDHKSRSINLNKCPFVYEHSIFRAGQQVYIF